MLIKAFTDQLNRTIQIEFPPKRIISLVPSQTELLYDLGLTDEVIAQTVFCIHPKAMHQTKPKIGGTKKLKMRQIEALKPDLIIANKEENVQEDIAYLEQKFPVWVSDVNNLQSAYEMISAIGNLVNKTHQSNRLIHQIKHVFNKLNLATKAAPSVLYLIWQKPFMAAGNHTFIHNLLGEAGFNNVISDAYSRYPVLDEKTIVALNPDLIFLSSEPFPFKEKHIKYFKEILPKTTTLLVDGEMFSWYGSRLKFVPDYFIRLHNQIELK